MKKFELLPAVDIKQGRTVRLKQGEINNKTIYGSPIECAL
ncbi:MAG: HisA/HisF-related TIM barrel protein, partial [Actinomycetota bacterium]|nr:HisA/HisF-related TIM barrel protein [Actinomycetota bacterium]